MVTFLSSILIAYVVGFCVTFFWALYQPWHGDWKLKIFISVLVALGWPRWIVKYVRPLR